MTLSNTASRTTRLAPSPTGALHLGNARTFLINWALAKQYGWKVAFRMEDLDTPRIKPWAVEQAIEILCWLGLDWDEPILYQSHDMQRYRPALQRLYEQGDIYPSSHSRKDVEQAQSAPHEDDSDLRFPPEFRPLPENCPPHVPPPQLLCDLPEAERPGPPAEDAWRLRVPDEVVCFDDGFAGRQCFNVQGTVGDFVVVTKQRLPAYQLAVVVDDIAQGVTDVVRGDDLLNSTARQILIYRLLGYDQPPVRYWHLPLVRGEDGRRLAKRHGDTRLAIYRDEHNVSAERIIGLLASWSGIEGERRNMDAMTFAQQFDIDTLPEEPITFTEEHHQWLIAG